MGRKRLGDLLKERGRVSQNDIDSAVLEQQRSSARLGELLLQRGLVDRDELISALEEVTHTKYVDCRSAQMDPQVIALIPRSVAARCCVLPVFLERKRLVVVMAEPQNLSVINELKFMSSIDISPRLGFAAEIQAAIEKHYGPAASGTGDGKDRSKEENLLQIDEADASGIEFFTNETRGGEEEALKEFRAAMGKQRTPAVRLFSAIVAAAADKRASDIHIDPQANNTVIRLRVDGILHDLLQVPLQIQESLVSRIKILANMDIAERRTPQDGRIMVRVGPHKLDLRAATLSTHYGEKVVIRLLDPRAGRISLADLGFSPDQVNVVTEILSNPQCMFLVTGPTGSGKTTTLYAALNFVRSRAVNVITVEDPIEYMIEGINQVQVNTKVGRTFAKCLRSILRQDPNVIMVGEIRDAETAEIALTASQTGHMVLSTLHTNDSVSAIMRLADLGVPAALIASSMSAVIAQRLVRKLCSCHNETPMAPQYAARIAASGFPDCGSKMLVPVGCPACDSTGYKGRVGVFEMLVFDDELRHLVRTGASPAQIHSHIRASGLRSFQEEALDKVRAGLTSFEEIFRVVPFSADSSARCRSCKRHLTPDFLLCPYCGTERLGQRTREEHAGSLEPVGKGGA